MRHRLTVLPVLAVASAFLLPPAPLPAKQSPVTVTAEDYARAESFLGGGTAGLVFGASVQPNWLAGDRFWYRNTTPGGTEFILADPAAGTRARAFDHERLAAAIGAVTGDEVAPLDAPLPHHRAEPVRRCPHGTGVLRPHRGGRTLAPCGRHAPPLRPGHLPVRGHRSRAGARSRRDHRPPTGRRPPSSATTTSGCAIWARAPRPRSPPTASRTSAMRPTTPGGSSATPPCCSGPPDPT